MIGLLRIIMFWFVVALIVLLFLPSSDNFPTSEIRTTFRAHLYLGVLLIIILIFLMALLIFKVQDLVDYIKMVKEKGFKETNKIYKEDRAKWRKYKIVERKKKKRDSPFRRLLD